MIGGLTVLTLVREAYEVKKGDWILVHAAAGGTGLILGQVLKDLGAHTIGTVSTVAKGKLAKEAGFEHHLTKPVDFQELETFLGAIAS